MRILSVVAILFLAIGAIFIMNKNESNAETNENQQTGQNILADEMAIRLAIDEIDNAVDAKDWARARTFFY